MPRPGRQDDRHPGELCQSPRGDAKRQQRPHRRLLRRDDARGRARLRRRRRLPERRARRDGDPGGAEEPLGRGPPRRRRHCKSRHRRPEDRSTGRYSPAGDADPRGGDPAGESPVPPRARGRPPGTGVAATSGAWSACVPSRGCRCGRQPACSGKLAPLNRRANHDGRQPHPPGRC